MSLSTTASILWILVFVAIFLVACGLVAYVSFRMGVSHRKKIAEMQIGSAEIEYERILGKATKEALTKKKEMLLEAKDEIHKLRTEADADLKERRNEILKLETRVLQKEELLDRKTGKIERKEEQLKELQQDLEARFNEVQEIERQQLAVLEANSKLTSEQAKQQLLLELEDELIHEKTQKLLDFEQQLQDEADDKAKELISLSIARMASEHVSESAISVVPLPSDEMKGRIIGREGRNIRAIETITGVDLIIDDTPEAITISCFDPVRREIARLTLEKLVLDGRIHPTRIEEMVAKSRREIELKMKREGERAVLETNLHGIHPEVIKILGRLHFRTSYRQNVLNHSIEVAHLAGIMAAELGIDPTKARRAGLLHDLGKALNHEIEGSHVQIGVDLCRRFKEAPDVIHAIEAHHNDVRPETVLACLVQAADAISAARPAARRENLESYIKRLEKLEEIATSFDGVERSFAIQAGREIRVMINPQVIKDEKMALVARDIAKKIENELNYPGQIKVNLIRESRTVDYAK